MRKGQHPRPPAGARCCARWPFSCFSPWTMSISFIPLRMAELVPAGSLSRDMLLGLPISAEMGMTGLSVLLAGAWIKRSGGAASAHDGAGSGGGGVSRFHAGRISLAFRGGARRGGNRLWSGPAYRAGLHRQGRHAGRHVRRGVRRFPVRQRDGRHACGTLRLRAGSSCFPPSS